MKSLHLQIKFGPNVKKQYEKMKTVLLVYYCSSTPECRPSQYEVSLQNFLCYYAQEMCSCYHFKFCGADDIAVAGIVREL